MESLPLKDNITKEELNSIHSSINLPSLGKLYVDKEAFFLNKNRYNNYINGIEHKENTTP